MDNAESHLKRIRDLHLPVDELAAYNSMAVYLRWAMERGQMSNPFLTQYRNVVEAVRAPTCVCLSGTSWTENCPHNFLIG